MSTMRSRIFVSLSAIGLCLAAVACSAPLPDEQEQAMAQSQKAAEAAAQPAPPPDNSAIVSGSCDAAQAQGLVGQALTDALTEQARADTGAKTVRVLKPNQMMTMEFNSDRLNLEVDEKNLITDVRCG